MKSEDDYVLDSSSMSLEEKIFWSVIAIFLAIWIFLEVLAYKNSHVDQKKTQNPHHNKPLLQSITKTIIKIVDDNDTIKNNLENPKAVEFLNQKLQKENLILDMEINKSVEKLFEPVYNNVDKFLDFHYSVIGEYDELIGAATNKLNNTIKERLFSKEFANNFTSVKDHINSKYLTLLKSYLKDSKEIASFNVDKELNSNVFTMLDNEINERLNIQKIKLGTFVGSAVAIKIIGVVSAKIIAKTASKIAAKSAIKAGAKVTASGSAAAAGLSCGPFAWICAPIAAGVAWFGTDAIVVSIDEKLHREDFKKEIIAMLDKQKEDLIKKTQKIYKERLVNESSKFIEDLKKKSVKKKIKEKITIKKKIGI